MKTMINIKETPETINGVKIRIRDWLEKDLELWEQWLQPGNKWRDFDGPYFPGRNSEQIRDLVAGKGVLIRSQDFGNPTQDKVIADLETDILVGRVSRYWQSKETFWLSVGIDIYDPELWSSGFGYEALGLWCDYLFIALR